MVDPTHPENYKNLKNFFNHSNELVFLDESNFQANLLKILKTNGKLPEVTLFYYLNQQKFKSIVKKVSWFGIITTFIILLFLIFSKFSPFILALNLSMIFILFIFSFTTFILAQNQLKQYSMMNPNHTQGKAINSKFQKNKSMKSQNLSVIFHSEHTTQFEARIALMLIFIPCNSKKKGIFYQKNDKILINLSAVMSSLHLIETLNEINPKLKWLDVNFIFTGTDHQYPWGTRAFFEKNSDLIEKYKDIYMIRMESVSGSTITHLFGGNTYLKNNQSLLLDMISHLGLTQSWKLKILHNYYNPIKMMFYPSNVQKYLKYCVILGKSETSKETLDIERVLNNPKSFILKTSELFYNLILTLDKRIEDKIQYGE